MSSSQSAPPPLLPRIAQGDAAAVEEFLDAYGPLINGIAGRLTRSAAEREDAVQDIFVELWRHAERFDPTRSSEPAFITMVSRRRLIDRRRRVARRGETEDLERALDIPSDVPDVAMQAAENDEVELARSALEKLRPQERKVLELSIWDGLTQSEIADQLDLPLGTVKTHARRGLQKVRESLSRTTT